MSEVNQLLSAILDRCGEVHEGNCPKAWVTLARKLEVECDALREDRTHTERELATVSAENKALLRRIVTVTAENKALREDKAFSFGAALIAAERKRQIESEGWTPE